MEHSRKINRKILNKEMKKIFTVLVCCAFVMAILPFSELALGQTPITAVSGSVTNSAGVGLSGVAVELRTTTGALVTSTVTDASGN